MKKHHSRVRRMLNRMIVNLDAYLDRKIQNHKTYTPRRKMWNRIITAPPLILVGFWLFYRFSFPGYLPGELIIPWQTSPIWLFGFLILALGLYILALPLIRKFEGD